MNQEQIIEQLRLTNMAIKELAIIVDEISAGAYNAEQRVIRVMLDE